MTGPALAQAAAALVLGCGLGLLHFGTLRRAVGAYLGGHPGRALLLQLARLAVLGACLYGAARTGALPLLAMALGVLAGRALVMRREGRESHESGAP